MPPFRHAYTIQMLTPFRHAFAGYQRLSQPLCPGLSKLGGFGTKEFMYLQILLFRQLPSILEELGLECGGLRSESYTEMWVQESDILKQNHSKQLADGLPWV